MNNHKSKPNKLKATLIYWCILLDSTNFQKKNMKKYDMVTCTGVITVITFNSWSGVAVVDGRRLQLDQKEDIDLFMKALLESSSINGRLLSIIALLLINDIDMMLLWCQNALICRSSFRFSYWYSLVGIDCDYNDAMILHPMVVAGDQMKFSSSNILLVSPFDEGLVTAELQLSSTEQSWNHRLAGNNQFVPSRQKEGGGQKSREVIFGDERLILINLFLLLL